MNEITILKLKNRVLEILRECNDSTLTDICKNQVLSIIEPLNLTCLFDLQDKLKNATKLHEVRELILSIAQVLNSAYKIC